MPINITDEFHAATTKGKIASAKEVFLTGDTENLQQIGEKTHQLEDSIKDIAATGGASTAAAVTFDNAASGMTAINAQGAIEELSTKNKAQDAELFKKANTADVNAKINEEKARVDGELEKKFSKADIAQELGDSESLVVSQKFITTHLNEIEQNNIYFFEDKRLGKVIQGIESNTDIDYIEIYQYMNRKTTSEYYSQTLSLQAYIGDIKHDFGVSYRDNEIRTLKEVLELSSASNNNFKIKVWIDWGALYNVSYALISPAIKINNSLVKVNYKTVINTVETSLKEEINSLKEVSYNFKGRITI